MVDKLTQKLYNVYIKSEERVSKMAIFFLNIETMNEEPGTFVKYVGPFKAMIKNQAGQKLVVDIDDFWAA